MPEHASTPDLAELLAAFETGALLRPDPAVPNLVDAARAVAAGAGAGGLDLSPFASDLAASLAEREHIVLILADGLGMEMLEREDGARTLRGNLRAELRTVFPSSSAVALTSLATGEWPARHAVVGWWTHIEEIGGPATILQYRRRSDDRSLVDLGVPPEQAFPAPSLWPRVDRRRHFLLPQQIADSVYSSYQAAGPAAGYRALAGASGSLVEMLKDGGEPTFAYVYVPHVDSEAHQGGPESSGVRAAILAVDRLVADLKAGLGESVAVVMTADHGHLGVTGADRRMIRATLAIPPLLASPASGDARVLEFHVRPGAHERFEEDFRTAFGRQFYLLTTAEVEELGLLGPGPLASRTRQRLGDFMAISRGPAVLGFQPSKASREALQQRSHHAGLTPAEMLVPLVVA